MKETKNYGLRMPEINEYVSIGDLNYNAEKMDVELKALDTATNAINTEINKIENTVNVTLPASGWSATAPYTQTVNVSGVTAADNPIVSLYLPDGVTAANVKLQTKAYGCLDKGVTGAGKIAFTCYNKKPASDFSVAIKGV